MDYVTFWPNGATEWDSTPSRRVVCVRAGWIEEGVIRVGFLCGRKRRTLATKSKPAVNQKQGRRKFIGGKLAMFAPCATVHRNAQESSCCLWKISKTVLKIMTPSRPESSPTTGLVRSVSI